jgi:hypothetical protein
LTSPPHHPHPHPHPAETPLFFECFPYVCPEPVLAKSSFIYINGAQTRVSLPQLWRRRSAAASKCSAGTSRASARVRYTSSAACPLSRPCTPVGYCRHREETRPLDSTSHRSQLATLQGNTVFIQAFFCCVCARSLSWQMNTCFIRNGARNRSHTDVRQVHTYLVSLPSARAASHQHSPVRQRITKPLKVRDGLQKTRFFLQLVLCLSRACLGEMVVST